MICLRCHHRKFEYGHHQKFGRCCLCAKCRRYIVVDHVSPNELVTLYMGLIAAEVKILGTMPSFELTCKYWPFPYKNKTYQNMWALWKVKAIQQFGENALHKAETQKVEWPTPQNLDLFAQGSL